MSTFEKIKNDRVYQSLLNTASEQEKETIEKLIREFSDKIDGFLIPLGDMMKDEKQSNILKARVGKDIPIAVDTQEIINELKKGSQ